MEKLTKEETTFILWMLGFVKGISEKMDEKHQEYINKHHDNILAKN